jgi:hypothetical protein
LSQNKAHASCPLPKSDVFTGWGRNSELIINKNNILLKVIDTNFSTSQFTVVLDFLKVTAYVKIPALRNTLAEKHVTKILKCFTISAAHCIYVSSADSGLGFPGTKQQSFRNVFLL